jgi:hypothetical protein
MQLNIEFNNAVNQFYIDDTHRLAFLRTILPKLSNSKDEQRIENMCMKIAIKNKSTIIKQLSHINDNILKAPLPEKELAMLIALVEYSGSPLLSVYQTKDLPGWYAIFKNTIPETGDEPEFEAPILFSSIYTSSLLLLLHETISEYQYTDPFYKDSDMESYLSQYIQENFNHLSIAFRDLVLTTRKYIHLVPDEFLRALLGTNNPNYRINRLSYIHSPSSSFSV